jgi:hypothetical protein
VEGILILKYLGMSLCFLTIGIETSVFASGLSMRAKGEDPVEILPVQIEVEQLDGLSFQIAPLADYVVTNVEKSESSVAIQLQTQRGSEGLDEYMEKNKALFQNRKVPPWETISVDRINAEDSPGSNEKWRQNASGVHYRIEILPYRELIDGGILLFYLNSNRLYRIEFQMIRAKYSGATKGKRDAFVKTLAETLRFNPPSHAPKPSQ